MNHYTTTDRPVHFEIGEIFNLTDKPISCETLQTKFNKLQNGSKNSYEDIHSLNYLSREVSNLNERTLNDFNLEEGMKNAVSASLCELAGKIEMMVDAVEINIAFAEFDKSYPSLNERFEVLIDANEDKEKLENLTILAKDAAEATKKFLFDVPDSKEKNEFLENSFTPLCEKISNLMEITIPFVKQSTVSENHVSKKVSEPRPSYVHNGYYHKQSNPNLISNVKPTPVSLSAGITEIRQSFALDFINKINHIDKKANKIFATISIEGKFECVRFVKFDNETNPKTLSYTTLDNKKSFKIEVSKLQGIEFACTAPK